MGKEVIEVYIESLRTHGEDVSTEEMALEYTLEGEDFSPRVTSIKRGTSLTSNTISE